MKNKIEFKNIIGKNKIYKGGENAPENGASLAKDIAMFKPKAASLRADCNACKEPRV